MTASTPTEIELKLRVGDPDALRARLAAAGAVRTRRVFEINRIFDTADGRLRAAGCGLRVRTSRDADDETVVGTLTFKGPRQPGGIKIREEIETFVADAEALAQILGRLGYREAVLYEKRRELWRFGDCAIAVDELPRLGWFMEIEGPSESAVLAARDQLGLANHEPVDESYVRLAAETGDRTIGAAVRLAFVAGTDG